MKKIVLTIMLSALAFAGFAQNKFDKEIGTFERVTKRGPYLTNRFFDNVFLGVGGGVNYYIGQDWERGDFMDRLAPALDVYLGKWITPLVGVRAQYSGLKAKQWGKLTNLSTSDTKKQFNVMNFHADFLFNISNAISGYKETRTWDFIPFVGFGGACSYDLKQLGEDANDRWRFAATGGLLNTIRLGGVVKITLEAKYMVVNSDFDWYPGTEKIDGMASVTAGLLFTFGPKGGFKRPEQPIAPDYTPYNQRISRLESDLKTANERADRLAQELQAEKNKPAPKPQVVKSATPYTLTVFFPLGSAVVDAKDKLNLEEMAKTIKADPQGKYAVIGTADSSTGSSAFNMTLSRKRADAVAKVLTDNGVNASQLVIDAKGGVKNHNNPQLDRAVIVKLN